MIGGSRKSGGHNEVGQVDQQKAAQQPPPAKPKQGTDRSFFEGRSAPAVDLANNKIPNQFFSHEFHLMDVTAQLKPIKFEAGPKKGEAFDEDVRKSQLFALGDKERFLKDLGEKVKKEHDSYNPNGLFNRLLRWMGTAHGQHLDFVDKHYKEFQNTLQTKQGELDKEYNKLFYTPAAEWGRWYGKKE